MAKRVRDYLKIPKHKRQGFFNWIAQDEKTLFHALLKHTILLELIMIAIQMSLGYALLHSKAFPMDQLIIISFVIMLIFKFSINKIKRGHWL